MAQPTTWDTKFPILPPIGSNISQSLPTISSLVMLIPLGVRPPLIGPKILRRYLRISVLLSTPGLDLCHPHMANIQNRHSAPPLRHNDHHQLDQNSTKSATAIYTQSTIPNPYLCLLAMTPPHPPSSKSLAMMASSWNSQIPRLPLSSSPLLPLLLKFLCAPPKRPRRCAR